MKKSFSPLFFIALLGASLFLPSCARYASERSLDCISLNMKKEEVMQRMRAPGVARGAILNKYGQAVEVREYEVQKPRTGEQVGSQLVFTTLTLGLGAPILLIGGNVDKYWLFFHGGRLVLWGQAGDWALAEKKVYDINFNVSSN